MDLAETHDNVKLHFEMKCNGVDIKNGKAQFEDAKGEKHNIAADLIFGSDGAFSAARLTQQTNIDRFDYHQFYIDCGYKELTIPAGPNGTFLIEKNALHIWPRGKYMMIALPNKDGSFTCTLFFPFEGEKSFAALKTREAVKTFFEAEFMDAVPLMPTLLDDFFNNPTSSLVTVKCFPWTVDNKLALIGDAAHAIVPFFGQGMNCGFEDCSVLNGLLEKYENDWPTILKEYQNLRKPDADAIADLAIGNFIEMRDLVADPKFLLRKKIEARFNEKYPEKWIPAYSMVTFSPHIRYSEALSKGQFQDKIMDEVMQIPNIESVWNSEEVEQLMLRKLN
jgi:kynurenine 3-monooxygenase